MAIDTMDKRLQSFIQFPKSALEGSIIARFRHQVTKHADKAAVKSSSVTWSYAELDRRANCVANELLNARGDQLEPIAIMMGQSELAVAAILGAIKAGKIYVPLDPMEAPDQIAGKLDHAGAPVILTDAANRRIAQSFTTRQRAVIEVEQALATSESTDPGLSLEPDRPVYIYYTSGSTGAPKGVFDDHRNVLHNILRYTDTLAIGTDDRLSLIQSPHFSGTVSSLFSALLSGATICPYDFRAEGLAGLSRTIRSEKLTIFHSVPSIFELLVATGDRFPDLRVIRLEGDQAFKRHIALFQANFSPPCVLVNGLGATETGLTRQFFIETDTPAPDSAVPIGFATPDMEALILSPEGGEVPVGEVGEIAIRSRYLARGYWLRPDLTAQVFKPCPDDPEARIYRSGDLGRMDKQGCLTYLGRQDFRVRVRGQWADLEAIQDAITCRPDVKAAVVLSLGGDEQEAKIVAYVVAEQSTQLDATILRRGLSAQLPSHMVPAGIVFLDAIPLDANGKIALKDLPPPDITRGQPERPAEPAVGEMENILAQCWQDALKRKHIGRHENFFDLGGDSLQAVELIHRIDDRLGQHLNPSAIVDTPTIASMAEAIGKRSPVPIAVPFPSQATKRPFFCVHGEGGQVLRFHKFAQALGADRPVYGIRLPVDGNRHAAVTTVEDMASLYLREIRTIQPQGPYLLGGYMFGGLVAFEMAHRLMAEGEKIACLALIGTYAPGKADPPTTGVWLRRHLETLQGLTPRERPAYLFRRVRNIPQVLAKRLRSRLNPSIRRDHQSNVGPPPDRPAPLAYVCEIAARKYQPPVLDHCNTVVYACKLEATAPVDPYRGWRDLVAEGLSFSGLGATPFMVTREPGVRELAQKLRQDFSATERGKALAPQ